MTSDLTKALSTTSSARITSPSATGRGGHAAAFGKHIRRQTNEKRDGASEVRVRLPCLCHNLERS